MPSIVTSGAMNAKAFGYGRNSDGTDIGDAVNYSVRFNSADTAQLTRTFGTPTNNTVWSWSAWVKLSKLTVARFMFGGNAASNYAGLGFNSADQFNLWSNAGSTIASSTAVYRDPAKYGHMFWVSNGTTIKGYWNNVEVLSYTGTVTQLNSAIVTNVGASVANGNYFDGYLADVCFVDGTALTPSSFGRTSPDTGAWVHKNPSGITWGTNGFRLQFNTGSVASDLGIDTSGNGNTFTVTNLSVTAGVGNDWLADTPTNTYCTWNPLDNNQSAPLNGALYSGGGGSPTTTRASIGFDIASNVNFYYAEFKVATAGDCCIGVSNQSAAIASSYLTSNTYYVDGRKLLSNAYSAYGNSYTAGDTIGVAVRNGRVWFAKNGVWQNSGDPTNATDANAAVSGLTGTWCFAHLSAGVASYVDANFGQRAFTYTPPTGFLALCTANLPTPAIGATAGTQATKGFVTALDTGTNIQTTLATARAGFGSDPYVEIFKNRAATEGWRVRFSADSSNYLDFSATAGKAAFPALVGANNYVGYALRISSIFGTATGTVSHTSGVADTVTHNLGNARCWILLKREDSTSNWFMYHPSLTAGSLLYLNLANGQTADTSITSVGANSFQIGSGVATGTYRYLIVVEKNGFCALTSHAGNSSTDGPFIWNGQSGAFELFQRYDVGQTNQIMDTTRSTYNVADASLYPVGQSAENAAGSGSGSAQLDFVSGGIKLRNNASGTGLNNSTGGSYIGVSLGGTAFKYSTAR